MKLIRQGAAAKAIKTRKNGPCMDPKFGAGEKLLKAADDLWLRLYRIAPMEMPKNGQLPPAPDTLDTFRRKRHHGTS